MKIIDCFPYNGETIALFRLQYLWDVVDEFVIVEAGETHSGRKKDGLFLDRNAAQLAPFRAKITPLVIERFPTPTEAELAQLTNPKRNTEPSAWFREKYQRNFATEYLRSRGAGNPWIVMGCDADEIPRRELVSTFPTIYDSLSAGYRLQMSIFYYSSRWTKRDKWYHAFAANDRAVAQETLDGLRVGPFIKKAVANAGWHLSYFMNDEEIQRKVQSFAHTELDSAESRNLEWIKQCMRTGKDLYKPGPEEDCLPYDGEDLPEGLRAFEALHGIGG
jgi:beta-1,4-mannosyl-glycoprotein beta-1,4-N-acetylglucosaminyltransferase